MSLRVTRRGVQIALGLIWLLDGVLQFQSYFFSQSFLNQMIDPMASGQPHWIASSIMWGARVASHHLIQYDTLFGLIQVMIGLGLLFPPTVRAALVVSFAWASVVWWFGEGLGMITMHMASPLTGAPGAVLLYAIIGLLVWPTRRADRHSAADGGPIGERGGLLCWSALWLLAAGLWLQAINRAPDAISSAIAAAQPNSMGWLASLQGSVASDVRGHGFALAVAAAVVSVAVGVAVWSPALRPLALWVGVALSLAYWLLGQGMGEINTTQATDPNAGPLFVLLALALMARPSPQGERAASPKQATGLHGSEPPMAANA